MDKKKLIITTLVTLSPMLLALALWDRLPEVMPTHFDAQGVADDWMPKADACFKMPLAMAVLNVFCHIAVANDPKRRNASGKLWAVTYWVVPAISLLCNGAVLVISLGHDFPLPEVLTVFCGLLFIGVGNYLPKCRQNYTVGIKLPWTLASEANWNFTHRIGGYCWIAAGLIFLFNAVIFVEWLFLSSLVLMLAVPVGASFWYYVKHEKRI